MNTLANLAASTGVTSTVLTVSTISGDNKELIVGLVSSLIVQVTIKLVEHFKRKRRIRHIKKSYANNNPTPRN
jgi:hypothetical protein